MNKIHNRIEEFKAIRASDPKIRNRGSIIYLKPYYWNYSFVTNFVAIAICVYILAQQNDALLNIVSILLIGAMTLIIFAQLRHYNTIYIDIENKLLKVYPNKILKSFIKQKTIRFDE